MKGLVITKKNSFGVYEAGRVKEEAEKAGIEVELWYWEDITVKLSGSEVEVEVNSRTVTLSDYKWCFARSASITPVVRLTHLKTLLMTELVARGVRVLNSQSLLGQVVLTKLMQQYELVKAGLPVAAMRYWGGGEVREIDYPVIVKKVTGSMGKGVFLAHDEGEVKEIEGEIGREKMLFQDFVPNHGDVRVLVLGEEALGAMKRIPAEGSHLSNVSAGGKAEVTELTEELKELAVKVTKVFGLEFAGVDIMYGDDGKVYVLEVNRHPQFGGFEKATRVNVGESIVEHLVRKNN